MKNEKGNGYFEEVETTTEYDGYYCEVAEVSEAGEPVRAEKYEAGASIGRE